MKGNKQGSYRLLDKKLLEIKEIYIYIMKQVWDKI